MDRRQKSTLRSLHIRIADELILDEDFYAALRRDKIFTNGMLEMIKNEGKPRDRVYKMLELLEKRGPKAFDNFVWILKENYDWLAKELEEQHSIRLQRVQQGREKNRSDQASVHSETEPKYVRYEQCMDSNIRPVSTPNPQLRSSMQTIVPTQESASVGFYNKTSQQFFPTHDFSMTQILQQQKQQQQQQLQEEASYDSTDNLTIALQTENETTSKQKKKQYKDACMSPIGIIESSRIAKHTMTPVQSDNNIKDETQSETDSYDQGFDEIRSETATVTSNNDDAESQSTCTTEVQSEGFETVSDNVDSVDGPVFEGLEEDDGDFPTSEVYYECVRRGSSRFSHLEEEVFHPELKVMDDDNESTRSEVSYEHSDTFQIHEEKMKSLYDKLNAVGSENEEVEHLEEDDIVTWEMINAEADKIINRLENSDDTKMITKCYKLFPEKERRQPLNACIETVFADKKEIENRLKDKQREIDQMVFDLWKHQQDMSNIKKLKKTQVDNETEIKNLKTSLENLETDADLKLKELEEKNARIYDLEHKLQELQSDQTRKPGVPGRRGIGAQRKVSNAQGLSPKRQTSYPYGEPRMSLMQGAYVQSSPRNVTTAMRRTSNNRK